MCYILEICPLVTLSSDQITSSPLTEDITALELASAARTFIISNADLIASSQTGQLSARLFIDVLESPQSPNHGTSGIPSSSDDGGDWVLTERVLLYCSRRVQDQEPLDEGNRAHFEDKAARKLNNKIHASASDTVTDEIRVCPSSYFIFSFFSNIAHLQKYLILDDHPRYSTSEFIQNSKFL